MIKKDINKYIEGFIKNNMEGLGDSDQHLLTIFSIALSCKGKTFLELGVRDGRTTTPILLAACMNKGNLVSVDINETDYKPPTNLKKHYTFIQSDALKYLKKIKGDGKKIDFAYIDDWHSYRHVRNEINLLDPHIGPSSIILLHDLMYGNSQPFYHTDLSINSGQWAEGGPYRAVAELDTNFWEWSTLPWNSGLTILRKKYSSKYNHK